ncbi:hypothetical protein NOCARDAX2BIS_530056 [Nocardioides sp. AX2bis]|nr:hypothetical protein NOCARDAX2BIS_530056 [Nocardioides sp. AX2bis]
MGDGALGRAHPRDGDRAGRPARRGRPGGRRRQLAVDRRRAARSDPARARRRVRRLRRVRGRLGPGERVRPDVRRLRRGRGAGPARVRRPASRGRLRLRPRRPTAGGGPLLQDGPQRHRVRRDAGLRRGLRAARGRRHGRQRGRRPRLLAWWDRDPVLAARPARDRAARRHAPRRHRRLGRRLRRGPVDRGGRDRPRRAGPCHRRVPVRPVLLPPGGQPRDEGRRRDAQPVRRPRHPHRAALGRRRALSGFAAPGGPARS